MLERWVAVQMEELVTLILLYSIARCIKVLTSFRVNVLPVTSRARLGTGKARATIGYSKLEKGATPSVGVEVTLLRGLPPSEMKSN